MLVMTMTVKAVKVVPTRNFRGMLGCRTHAAHSSCRASLAPHTC